MRVYFVPRTAQVAVTKNLEVIHSTPVIYNLFFGHKIYKPETML